MSTYKTETASDPGDTSSAPIRETPPERGLTAAKATERARVLAVLSGAQKDVDRTALKKALNQQSRDAYDRAYGRLERAAQVHADETYTEVEIPVRDPPAELPPELHQWARALAAALANHKIVIPSFPVPALTRVIKPLSFEQRTAREGYTETLGMGPSGKGAPPPNFANPDANDAWLNVQGVAS